MQAVDLLDRIVIFQGDGDVFFPSRCRLGGEMQVALEIPLTMRAASGSSVTTQACVISAASVEADSETDWAKVLAREDNRGVEFGNLQRTDMAGERLTFRLIGGKAYFITGLAKTAEIIDQADGQSGGHVPAHGKGPKSSTPLLHRRDAASATRAVCT